jgi:tetratricopeptide (TPR) repeat protein
MMAFLFQVGLALLMAASLGTQRVAAQAVRVVLLAKHTLEGAPSTESGLDSAASAALARTGSRLVDMDSALRAQRFALSDAVQSGHIPNELTVLNADALASLQLRCAKSADKLLGTQLIAEQCVLDTKVIATSNGDVIHAQSESFTGHGLNAQMAVQTLLDRQLPAAIERGAQAWLTRFTRIGSWELDLTVTRLTDRETARALAKLLTRLPGVSGARMGVFDRGIARYALAGSGQAELDRLADEIEADPRLSLRVSYEAPHVLHAEYDFAKAQRRMVMVMAVAPTKSALRGVAPELVRASLMNLPYLEMAHTQPLLASPEQARSYETRLRDKARALHVPLVLCGTLAETKTGFSATLKLVESETGRTLVASAAESDASAAAFDSAVHALDDQFRTAIAQSDVRTRLGLQNVAHGLERDTRLVIHAFQLPTLNAEGKSAQGSLLVRNTSTEAIKGGRVTVSTASREVEDQPLPDVEPGAIVKMPIPLAGIAQFTQSYLLLTAAVTYNVGGVYERVTAVAQLVRSGKSDSAGDYVTTGAPETYLPLIRQGVQYHQAGDFQTALAIFQRAHQLFPNARTLRALGMVEYDLGHYGPALEVLNQALSASARPLTPELRSDVVRLAAHTRALLEPAVTVQ